MTATVVIVEQSAAIARSIASTLSACGLGVAAICHDGLAGVEAIVRHRPNVVVFDLLLPRLGGLPMVAAIARAELHPRLVAVTAVTSRERVVAAREAGVSFYILKPIDWDRLRKVASSLCPAEEIHARTAG